MRLCPQFACLLIVYRTILVGQIFKEIKVGIVAVLHSVGAGDAYHSAGKLSKLAVFIGEGGGIEVGAGDGERLGYFWTGNQPWAMQRPRSHASQPIQPGVLTVSVSSL